MPDDSVSRRHARFEIAGDICTLEDMGSTNGVYINDRRIARQRLTPGDRVRFGNQIFRFLGGDHIETEYFETVYRMMTTDGLTEACNKRFLLEMLERELPPVATEQMQIPVTISVGIGEFSGSEDITVDTLLARADTQLYAAKRTGRNRVCG